MRWDTPGSVLMGALVGAFGGQCGLALLLARFEKRPDRRARAYAWIGVGLMAVYFAVTIGRIVATFL